jgi:hypothetical protein
MARIQLSMEELMKLVEHQVPYKEMKESLAKAIIEVWNSREMRAEIDKYAEELARKKVERTIESAFKITEVGYYGNRRTEINGWAANLIKEQLKGQTAQPIIDALTPDIDKVITERINIAFGKLLGGQK